jgi:hypothetical protein
MKKFCNKIKFQNIYKISKNIIFTKLNDKVNPIQKRLFSINQFKFNDNSKKWVNPGILYLNFIR